MSCKVLLPHLSLETNKTPEEFIVSVFSFQKLCAGSAIQVTVYIVTIEMITQYKEHINTVSLWLVLQLEVLSKYFIFKSRSFEHAGNQDDIVYFSIVCITSYENHLLTMVQEKIFCSLLAIWINMAYYTVIHYPHGVYNHHMSQWRAGLMSYTLRSCWILPGY